MKFLILGVSGMAGHVISIYLKEQGHDVLGFSLNKIDFCECIVGDAKDSDSIKKIVDDGNYDAIINCIGILNQFAEQDKALAVYLNAYLPHFLAKITRDSETQIIHMSTDCVFSGETGSYTENSFRDGKTFYDRTKALGELEDNKNLTLRNSIVGPDINPNGIGLLNWFMKQNNPIDGYSKVMWTGLTTLQLAKIMEEAAKRKVGGLYNMVYKESISKFNLIKLFNHYLKDDTITINENQKIACDKSLTRTNFDFNFVVPDYDTMISELSTWMYKHKGLYPHYNL